MNYLCMAYCDEKKTGALPKAELDAIAAQCPAYDALLKATGHLVLHGSLADARSSTVVRPKRGKPVISDGPFLETKEYVGGFFLIEAEDLDEAISLSMKHPAAHLGESAGWGIEIRPIGFFEKFK